MKRLMFALAVLVLPALAHAQAPVITPPITSVRFVIAGGVAPVTNDLPIAGMVSQPAANCVNPTGTVHNPTAFIYKINLTDTTCWQYTDPGNGPLISLPVGGTTYTATLAYLNSQGAGPASPVSNPFDRPGTAPAVTPAIIRVVP